MTSLNSLLIAGGISVALITGAYFKGCSDGKDSGRQEKQVEVDKWKGQYLDLRDQTPKRDTVTVTKYVTLPRRVDTVAAVSSETEDEVTSEPYPVPSPGTVTVTYMRLASPWERFRFDFQPSPLRVDTVYVTETKTALEYVKVSIFDQTEFYILTVVAAVGGFALAGGF